MKTCDKLDSVLESGIVHFPYTPSKWTSELKKTPVATVHMTCGGGMGGASWNYYVKNVECDGENYLEEAMKAALLGAQKFITVELYDGSIRTINKNYIVDVDYRFCILEAHFHTDNYNVSDPEWILYQKGYTNKEYQLV